MDLLFPLDTDQPQAQTITAGAPGAMHISLPSPAVAIGVLALGLVISVQAPAAVTLTVVSPPSAHAFTAVPPGAAGILGGITVQAPTPPPGIVITPQNVLISTAFTVAASPLGLTISQPPSTVVLGPISATAQTATMFLGANAATVQTITPIQVGSAVPIVISQPTPSLSFSFSASPTSAAMFIAANDASAMVHGLDQTVTPSSVFIPITAQLAQFTGIPLITVVASPAQLTIVANTPSTFLLSTGGHPSTFATLVTTGQTGVILPNG